jgi:hypothetical protein
MSSSQLPIAVRATAAALAVFMTITLLNGVVSIAEPQQSQLMAQRAPRQTAQVASAPTDAAIVARTSTSTTAR